MESRSLGMTASALVFRTLDHYKNLRGREERPTAGSE